MTKTNDPPLVASVSLIPDSNEKADLDAPSDESGKLVVGQVPNISISETIVVADQAERLSLEVQEGDVAIQQDTTESFIFTGGPNIEINWQLVQFDAVGGIAGEDIAPRDIDGRNVVVNDVSTGTLSSSSTLTATDVTINGLLNGADTSGAAAGEALTSDGQGGFGFASVGGIEEVSTFGDLPAIDPPQIAYVTEDGDYYHSEPESGTRFDIDGGTVENSIPTQDSTPEGFDFSDDGLHLYEVGYGNDGNIYQSNLTEAFDLSTASFVAKIDSAAAGGSNRIGDVTVSQDGTKIYEAEKDSGNLFQFALSTPFELSTATLEKTISAPDIDPRGIDFADGGSKVYIVGTGQNKIYQLSLSTPFDIGTASLQSSFSVETNFPNGIVVSNDGDTIITTEDLDFVVQYELSTPFDVSTATFNKSRNGVNGSPESVRFDSDGSTLFELAGGEIVALDLIEGGWEEF